MRMQTRGHIQVASNTFTHWHSYVQVWVLRMKMSDFSRSRIILFLFCIFTPFVLGSKCECETESLSHPGCGVIPTSSTIINGSPAYHPWMVFLYTLGDTENCFCGGILISDLQILSAAHCFEGKTIDEVLKEAVVKPFHINSPFDSNFRWLLSLVLIMRKQSLEN